MTIVNGITLFLTFVSSLFFLIGCIGYSGSESTIKSVHWFRYHDDQKVWFGLQKAYVDIDLAPYVVIKDTVAYNSDACTGDYCDSCYRDGMGTLGLLIVALIFTLISLSLNGASTASPSAPIQMANAFTALIAFLTSLIAMCVFMGDCYSQVALDAPSYVLWGPGSVLTILGMIFMFVVSIMKLGAAFCGCCGSVKGGQGGLTANTGGDNL